MLIQQAYNFRLPGCIFQENIAQCSVWHEYIEKYRFTVCIMWSINLKYLEENAPSEGRAN